MVGELGYVEKVVDDPAHYRAGLVVVKVFERKSLQVRKNVVAHIRLHPDTDDVTVVGDEVVESEFCEVNTREDRAEDQKKADVAVGDEVANHRPRDERIKEVCHREDEREGHVRNKQFHVRFIVFCKAFDHSFTAFPFFVLF